MFKKQFMHSNNINYLLFEPTYDNKHVTIILYHGWGSSIYNQTFLASILANLGYTVSFPKLYTMTLDNLYRIIFPKI